MAACDKRKRMIDVADFMFANPAASRADIIAHFRTKLQISTRTFDVIIKDARKYNEDRVNIHEKAKNEAISECARRDAEKNIISREEALAILSTIGKGGHRTTSNDNGLTVEDEGPSYADRIRAITQMAKMQGWEAPQKNEMQTTLSVDESIITPDLRAALADLGRITFDS